MKLRALIACMLTLALIFCVFAGCTPEGSQDTPTDPEVTTAPELPPLSVEVTDGVATVTTDSGFGYTASGFDAVANDTFAVNQGLLVSLGDAFVGSFNRFTVKYSATAPMKITISYTEKDAPCEDVFYLEAGEHEFSAVNHKFFLKVKGSALTSIRVDTCKGESAEFMLYDLKTETVSVPDHQQYLYGSRYTLGVDLKWGGTINILEDKQCTLEDVTNLVNLHDEGRLIQQSYYGVFYYADQYVEGGYQGVEGVAYNPVQGGDGRGRDSRIIDFIIEDDYIYVKAQPLDWPMNNSLTKSEAKRS